MILLNRLSSSEVVELLKTRPELHDLLSSAVRMEEDNEVSYRWNGFEWYELPAHPQTLRMLVLKKVLKVNHKTGSRTYYRLSDREAVEEALRLVTILMMDSSETEEIPADLFDDVVGYEDVKQLFFKTIHGESEDRVHYMMIGAPASAKSLFLLCLEKLPKSKYVLGSRSSKAGLADYLISTEPTYLLIDEIDKMALKDYDVLLSLCETGRVTEVVYGKMREVQLDTIVFASGNRLNGIPPEVMSRFQVLHFHPYSETEFTQIVSHVLSRRQVAIDLALYIAKKVSSDLGSRDVRQAIRIAKLAKDYNQVDSVIRTLLRYSEADKSKLAQSDYYEEKSL